MCRVHPPNAPRNGVIGDHALHEFKRTTGLQGKADMVFMDADAAWDAWQGKGKAFKEKIPLRMIAVWSSSTRDGILSSATRI